MIVVDGRIVGTWDTEDGSIALRFGKISKKTVSMLEDHVERRYHEALKRLSP